MIKMHLFTFQVYVILLLVFCAKLSKSTLSYNADDKGDCDCGEGELACYMTLDSIKLCVCKDGYAFDSRDIVNKCFSCKNWCNENARTCKLSSEGTVNCTCKPGFELEQISNQCMPCDCGPYGNCSYTYDNHTKCTCEEGYEEDRNKRCTDCDCGLQVECQISKGNKTCFCPTGFEQKLDQCQDVDECLDSRACPKTTFCINTNGSYECACLKGYEDLHNDTKSYGCQDIDECLDSRSCPNTTYCINTNGSYECACLKGYVDLDNNTKSHGCQDCDCGLQVDCQISKDNKTCFCPTGFEQKLDQCQDIDECLDSGACPKTTYCVNTVGSYQCACLKGYENFYRNTKSYGCQAQPPWKIIIIVLSVALSIFIVSLVVVIYRRKRLNSII